MMKISKLAVFTLIVKIRNTPELLTVIAVVGNPKVKISFAIEPMTKIGVVPGRGIDKISGYRPQ